MVPLVGTEIAQTANDRLDDPNLLRWELCHLSYIHLPSLQLQRVKTYLATDVAATHPAQIQGGELIGRLRSVRLRGVLSALLFVHVVTVG